MRLREDGLHPLESYAIDGKSPPGPWGEKGWIVYLDSESALWRAIRYVEQNPLKEGKSRQHWSFVKPFAGLTL